MIKGFSILIFGCLVVFYLMSQQKEQKYSIEEKSATIDKDMKNVEKMVLANSLLINKKISGSNDISEEQNMIKDRLNSLNSEISTLEQKEKEKAERLRIAELNSEKLEKQMQDEYQRLKDQEEKGSK